MKFVVVLLVLINFALFIQAKNEEICSEPKEVGPCRAQQPYVFFNSETKQCEDFFYGGCRGNRNRFITKQACQETCL